MVDVQNNDYSRCYMSYYKYQNVKSIDEYQEICDTKLKKLKERIDAKAPFMTEIPIFRDCEFDIDKLDHTINDFITYVYNVEQNDGTSALKSTLSNFMSRSHASYIAPAYNFNNYLEFLISYNIDNFNHQTGKYAHCTNYLYTVHIHNIFISIKCMLDRLIPILSYYYNGLDLKTTFGRISSNKKSKGVMSRAIELKESDPLMRFIYEEYFRWIKRIIEPRDMIIHYNDMSSQARYTVDEREFPMHYDIKIFNDNELEDEDYDPDDGYYYKSLMKDVQNLYFLLDNMFDYLKGKPIVYKKQHFIHFNDFEEYRNNNYSFIQK
jgi:hypothetical protein